MPLARAECVDFQSGSVCLKAVERGQPAFLPKTKSAWDESHALICLIIGRLPIRPGS